MQGEGRERAGSTWLTPCQPWSHRALFPAVMAVGQGADGPSALTKWENQADVHKALES